MLRVGIIGTGRISDLHAIEYLQSERAQIVAVCDIDEESARRRAGEWGVPPARVFSNHHDLLALPDLDLVEILLPHHLHHPVTLDALAAGKHVSVQKPMALTLAQADEMIAAAAAADKTLRVYENFIFYPPVVRARALIDAGEIGDPLTIRIKSNAGFSPTAWHVPLAAWAWRFNPEICGGGPMLFDDGHHKFALAWHFMGLAEQVHAWIGEMELMPGRVLDTPAIVSWKFPGNRFGSLEVVYSPQLQIDTRYYAPGRPRRNHRHQRRALDQRRAWPSNRRSGRRPLPRWQDPYLRRHPHRLGAELHPRHPPPHRRTPRRRPAKSDRRRRPHNPALPPRRPTLRPHRPIRPRLTPRKQFLRLTESSATRLWRNVKPLISTSAFQILCEGEWGWTWSWQRRRAQGEQSESKRDKGENYTGRRRDV